MNPLFSKSSMMLLESLSFTQTLYAFDFDGTLSRIVGAPTEARLSATTEKLLHQLSRFAPVAIVSGRSLDDLQQRIRVPIPYLIGNHGLEGLVKRSNTLEKAVEACLAWSSVLASGNLGPGVEIENKTYSLAIHYRRSRNKKQARQLIHEAVAALVPAPRLILGKQIVNLLPPGAPHKGVAVLDLLQLPGMKQVFYIGDDDTDEDVFSLPDDQIMSARVGQKKNSNARYFIRRQTEINRLLEVLIAHYQRNLPGGGEVL